MPLREHLMPSPTKARAGGEDIHRESLEEEATHAIDEARMVLPGVQAIMGFQLIAVFNQKFDQLGASLQVVHLSAFLLIALAMGLIMAPAAFHRQVERGYVSRRFVNLASTLLTAAMVALLAGLSLDTFVLCQLVLASDVLSGILSGATAVVLFGLWFVLPRSVSMLAARKHRR
jgi:Family of unknown function (DUF6328)